MSLRSSTTKIWKAMKTRNWGDLGSYGSPKVTGNVIWWSTHDFLFEFNRNYASTPFILYCFRVVASHLSEVANFNLPHLHLEPLLGMTPFKFCGNLWCQKTRVPGLLWGVACVILCLAILIQYWHVTDGYMNTRRRLVSRWYGIVW